MTDTVLYSVDAHIATITLNRPDRLNTMGEDLLPRALEAIERAASDDDVRVVIFTGAGKGFCAGGDVGRFAAEGAGGAASSFQGRVDELRGFMRSSQLLMEMPKVTIAAINGACAGAGFSWACACDLRYAADNAKFNVAFRNAGLSGDFGGTWNLPRIVGPAKARELYFLSERFDAATAARIGLVTEVFDKDEFRARVGEVAAGLANAAPIALKHIKENLNDSARVSFSEALDREAQRHITCAHTEDHREAARAFMEKRPGNFNNR